MTQGHDAFSEQELQAFRDDMAQWQSAQEPQRLGRILLESGSDEDMGSSHRGSGSGRGEEVVRYGTNTDDYSQIVQALSLPDVSTSDSPLRALQRQIHAVFMHGPLRASGVFQELRMAAENKTTTADKPMLDLPVPWNSCKAAATLVALFACPKAKLYDALSFQSGSLGGLPTLPMIRNTPSSSFLEAYRTAKDRARGEKGITTVMSVSLIDVHIFELARQGKAQTYTSFAHTFVFGVGPEGVIIWQGWGEHGYGLDEYIKRDGARIRTWQEAGDFVDRFEKFASHKGLWDAKRNKFYNHCFEVDVIRICGPQGPSRPIVPKCESWVRLLVFEDVKLEHIHKFTFK